MTPRSLLCVSACLLVLGSCGDDAAGGGSGGGGKVTFVENLDDLPPAGHAEGDCDIPAEARPEDTSAPDHVIGDGTKESCTSDAVVEAVAKGGVITFDCGPEPITITLDRTAKIVNDTGPKVVIDGGGKVALSGGKKVRILYQDTCDQAQKWTTSHCDNQDHPQLAVQNLTFIDGTSRGEPKGFKEGGGAIFVSGGRLKIVNSRFFANETGDTGELASGGAVRVFQQFDGKPVYVVNSTFGGDEKLGNVGGDGGAISGIGVSFTVINSWFSHNHAVDATKGDGGAIYNDGNTYTLSICGSLIEHNTCVDGGGGIFYVSNDGSGRMILDRTTLRDNPSGNFETEGYPGIFVKTDQPVQVTDSVLEK
jgi:hypothetical protein